MPTIYLGWINILGGGDKFSSNLQSNELQNQVVGTRFARVAQPDPRVALDSPLPQREKSDNHEDQASSKDPIQRTLKNASKIRNTIK